MAFNTLIREEAQKDIIAAGSWYEAKQKGLGTRFVSVVEDQIQFIPKFPEVFALKKHNFREAVLRDFPNLVIYTFEKGQVIGLAVFHTHQNPNKKP